VPPPGGAFLSSGACYAGRVINYYQKTVTTRKLKKMEEFRVGSWVHVEDPSTAELDLLAEQLKLDRGLLSDSVDPYEVPRVEVEEGTTYIFTRIPYEDEQGKIQTSPALLGVAESFVFSVTRTPLPFFARFIDGHVPFHTTQKVRLLLQMLMEVDVAYSRFITLISKEVRRLQARLDTQISNRDIIRFVHFETVLNDLLDALVPTNAAVQKVLSGKFLVLYEEDKDFVEDMYLANNQLIELCRSNIRTIMNIRTAYSTIMSNTLNRVIKLLTSLTIVLTIPTIIVNLYGMNVPLPFQSSAHAFWIIMGMATALTLIVLWVLHRKHLL
jgi:magnesium transporter